ncbi:hypothetical protein ACJRO7_019268 [Eucalyptus globulus]|uniref:Thioesterase domain-containing protein n=1 Tax=Eucalyptus globulus TaxID=34317 RepID=A0ABD3KHU6_EUCGL
MATGPPAKVSPDVPRERVEVMCRFFENTGVSDPIPPPYAAPDGYSDLLRVSLKADQVRRGKVSCHLSVGPPLLNTYGGLHGGAVAAVAERVAIGCARTVIREDKELFLGELSISYLSAAPDNVCLFSLSSVIFNCLLIHISNVKFLHY